MKNIRAHKQITSLKNPVFQNLIKLRERQERDRRGCFGLEGLREIRRAVDCGYTLLQLWFVPAWLSPQAFAFIRQHFPEPEYTQGRKKHPALLVETGESCFKKLVMREQSDGIYGLMKARNAKTEELSGSKEPPLILVLEGIEKPGNLGAALRSADGAGASGIILIEGTGADQYNPALIRNSLGTVFALPVLSMTAQQAFDFLQKNGITCWATAMGEKAISWDQADFCQGSAIFIGNEARGLRRETSSKCQGNLRIPMLGIADSLNVSAAASLLLYEARRQRIRRNSGALSSHGKC